jgi:hypothetical protein
MPLNSIIPDLSEGDEDIDAVINRIAAEAERNMVTMSTSFCQTIFYVHSLLYKSLPLSSPPLFQLHFFFKFRNNLHPLVMKGQINPWHGCKFVYYFGHQLWLLVYKYWYTFLYLCLYSINFCKFWNYKHNHVFVNCVQKQFKKKRKWIKMTWLIVSSFATLYRYLRNWVDFVVSFTNILVVKCICMFVLHKLHIQVTGSGLH